MKDAFNEEPTPRTNLDGLLSDISAEQVRGNEIFDDASEYLDRIKAIAEAIKQELYTIPGLMDNDYEQKLNAIEDPSIYDDDEPLMDRLLNTIARETQGEIDDSNQWELSQKLLVADEVVEQVPSDFSIDPFTAAIDIAGGKSEPLYGMSREEIELQNIVHNPTLTIEKIVRTKTRAMRQIMKPEARIAVELYVFPGEHDKKSAVITSVAQTAGIKGLCDSIRFRCELSGGMTPEVDRLLASQENNAEIIQRVILDGESAEFIETIKNITEELRPTATRAAVALLNINVDDTGDTPERD